MFYTRRFQWTFLLIFSFNSQFLRTTALQCYSCENCNDYEDLQELHICGELPSDLETVESSSRPTTYTVTNDGESITRTTTTTNTPLSTDITEAIITTTIRAEMKTTTEMTATTTMMTDRPTDDTTKVEITTTTTTTTPTITNEEYTTFYENTEETTLVNVNEDNVETTSTTTQTIPSTTTESTMTTTTATTVATATAAATTNQNTEENYDDFGEGNNVDYYDDYFLLHKKMHTIQRKQFIEQPICYMTTSFVNGTVKINRGCTNMINNNQHDTCESILKDSQMSVGDCQICNTNGCNKFFSDFSPQPPTTANTACKNNNALFIHIIFISSTVFINLRF